MKRYNGSRIPDTVAADNIESLAERLRANGFIVLENIVPLELLRQIFANAFEPLLEEHIRRASDRGLDAETGAACAS